jgi:hypothetical protein
LSNNIENSVIEHLKTLRRKLKEFRYKHNANKADIKHRLTALERGMGAVKRDASDGC